MMTSSEVLKPLFWVGAALKEVVGERLKRAEQHYHEWCKENPRSSR
jgi:hypothetical protein